MFPRARDVLLLLHRDARVRQMLATHHSSPEGAARDFARIKPKLAVYTHFTRPRRDDIPEVLIDAILSRNGPYTLAHLRPAKT